MRAKHKKTKHQIPTTKFKIPTTKFKIPTTKIKISTTSISNIVKKLKFNKRIKSKYSINAERIDVKLSRIVFVK